MAIFLFILILVSCELLYSSTANSIPNQTTDESKEVSDYKLSYFPIRGRAEPIRILFHYLGVPFVDEAVSMEEWPKVKPTTPFGQMPVLTVDKNLQLAQTTALLRYIAYKHGMKAKTDEENALVDMYGEQIQDSVSAIAPYMRAVNRGVGDREVAKTESLIPNIMNVTGPIFEKRLKENKNGFLVGDKLTWVDIMAAEYFDRIMESAGAEIFNEFPLIKSHRDKIFSLPAIEKYTKQRPQLKSF